VPAQDPQPVVTHIADMFGVGRAIVRRALASGSA